MEKNISQFMSCTFSQRGGGERVMGAIYKLFNAALFTFKKNLSGEEYKEIGSETDRRLSMRISKV